LYSNASNFHLTAGASAEAWTFNYSEHWNCTGTWNTVPLHKNLVEKLKL